MEREQLFYLNGQAKRLTEKAKQGEKVTVKSAAYWDSGKVQRHGQFDEVREQRNFGWGAYWRYDDLKEQGEFRSYYENGALESVEHYLDGKPEGVSSYYYKDGKTLQREVTYTKGVMSRVREFKKSGALVRDDALFKDGSRKSLKK